jgi:hypothetical protein
MNEEPEDDPPVTARRRRFRPGSSSSGGWSPFLSSSSAADAAADLEREIAMLERALEDRGDLQRNELIEVTGSKYWGPGRFGKALRAALDQGRVRKVGVGRYGL